MIDDNLRYQRKQIRLGVWLPIGVFLVFMGWLCWLLWAIGGKAGLK